MINKLILTILKIITTVLSFILNIIFLPLTAIMDSLFPNITDFATNFNYLCTNYIFKGVRFIREVFLNMTCINRDLVGILFSLPLIWFSFYLANQGVRLLVSIYRLWKGSKG